MLKVQEIRELIRLVDQSDIDEFEYQNEGVKLVMKKNPAINNQVVTVQSPVPPVQTTTPAPVQASSPVQETQPAQTQSVAPAQQETGDVAVNLHKITSPMVGTFYRSSSPDADPYVSVGSKVQKDSVVCIVEAMKLFNEIEAEVNGEIVEVLVQDGQLVEFGQPLFLVKSE